MKFILIIGPQAVGKMAVGLKLSNITGLKLFHNHMSIEMVLKMFEYHTKEAKYLINLIRKEVFQAMASSDLPGMIFTYIWAFNFESDRLYVEEVLNLFESHGAETYIVELESDLETRIQRNETVLRLEEKPTKRNLEWSRNEIVRSMDKYRMNSFEDEIKHPNYLRINNSCLSVDDTVKIIIEHFNLVEKDI